MLGSTRWARMARSSNSSSSCRPILGQDRCNECGTYGCAKNRAPTILLPAAENALMQRVSGWVGVIFTDSTIGSNCGVMRGGGGGQGGQEIVINFRPQHHSSFPCAASGHSLGMHANRQTSFVMMRRLQNHGNAKFPSFSVSYFAARMNRLWFLFSFWNAVCTI